MRNLCAGRRRRRNSPPHAVLDLDRRAHSVGDALKLDQHAFTRRLDDGAAVLVDTGSISSDAMGAQAGERAVRPPP